MRRHMTSRAMVGEQPLITPALFSHRPSPNREKRENGKKRGWG